MTNVCTRLYVQIAHFRNLLMAPAVIVAVRQGLDISTRKSATICLIGWTIVQILIGFVQVLEQQLIR
ncbi:hypothetical protein [Dulcicalothrix desertica]|uniref:hypothetical protein n=1 Tax=Dulcicalothrix desertica TaxID=32056 RepID=UPI0013155C4E|nr:hypothetical protein [Dulcicalothrix desertica]